MIHLVWNRLPRWIPTVFFFCVLTFEFEGELIGIVEGEHLLVRRLLICVEDELSGEHKHGKASFHQLRLSMLLLLHWLQLSSSSSPSTVGLGPPPRFANYHAVKLPAGGNGTSPSHSQLLRAMTWYCETTQAIIDKAWYLHFDEEKPLSQASGIRDTHRCSGLFIALYFTGKYCICCPDSCWAHLAWSSLKLIYVMIFQHLNSNHNVTRFTNTHTWSFWKPKNNVLVSNAKPSADTTV